MVGDVEAESTPAAITRTDEIPHPEPALEPRVEVRLAIVMYGGSSLAIYINGVAQELLNLVKATAPASREVNETKPLFVGKKVGETQKVYRKLAQLIDEEAKLDDIKPDDPLVKRFVVDIITGTSAGGINGIFLAKALVGERSMESLKDLWVREGDIGKLINDKESARGLPILKSKQPPESLLNGQRMYWQLLRAFEQMDEGLTDDGCPIGDSPPQCNEEGEVISRFVQQLDLYVTATDLSGLVLPMKLTDQVISEPRHRNVHHFVYNTKESSGEYRNDFEPRYNPFLAFAARCTSSLPFVFEPMQLIDIDKAVKTFDRFKDDPGVGSGSDRWHRFFPDYVGPRTAGDPKTDFPIRAFGDGGALDNSPFSYATDELNKRRSDLPVVRKLLYVEPDPKIYESGAHPKSPPDAIRNLIEQAVVLPRTQTIREDLDKLLTRNRQNQRVKNILMPLREDLNQALIGENDDQLVTSAVVAEMYLEELIGKYGVSYGTYQRLRVAELTDDLARLFTHMAGLNEDSDDFLVARYIVRAWRDQHYMHYQPRENEKIKEPFTKFLVELDTSFALRRLHYLRMAMDELMREPEPEQVRVVARRAKARLNECLVDLSSRMADVRTRSNGNPVFHSFRRVLEKLRSYARDHATEHYALDPESVIDPTTEALRRGLVMMVLEKRTEQERNDLASDLATKVDDSLNAVMNELTDQISPVLAEVDELVAEEPPPRPGGARVWTCLQKNYENFVSYDLLAYPLQSGTNTGETGVVEIHRVSPKDAQGLINVTSTERKKVAGAAMGHFGAFFNDAWRKNDIMWGRLDAAERLIKVLVPPGGQYDDNVRKLCGQAYGEILSAELTKADRAELDKLMASALATLPPESRTTRDLIEFIKKDSPDLDERFEVFLRVLLDDPAKLVDYYHTTFTLDLRPPQPEMLRNAARATHVTGEVLQSVSQQKAALLVSPMKWVSRIGRVFTGAVEAATPGNTLHVFARHWLVMAFILEAILILGGAIFNQQGAQQLGWGLLWITIVVAVLLSLLSDVIRGGVWWQAALRVGLMLAVLAAAGMVVLEWRHLAEDLSLDKGSLSLPPSLPFEKEVAESQKILIVSLILSATWAFALVLQGRGLKKPPLARGGIVSLEMAGSRARVAEILGVWGSEARKKARTNLYMDFALILLYVPALFLAVAWATDVWRGSTWEFGAWIGFVLAWVQVAAGALDALENVCLLAILKRSDPGDRRPRWARLAAQAKFLFLGLGAFYALISLVRQMMG